MNWITPVKDLVRWVFQLCEFLALISLELVGMYYLYKALGFIA
jgi:hypothetical protein